MEEQVEYERLLNIDDNDNYNDEQIDLTYEVVSLMRKDRWLYKSLNFTMIKAISQLLEGVYMAQDVSSDLMATVASGAVGLNFDSRRSFGVEFRTKYDSIRNKLESINCSFKSLLSEVKELHDLVYSDYNERVETIFQSVNRDDI